MISEIVGQNVKKKKKGEWIFSGTAGIGCRHQPNSFKSYRARRWKSHGKNLGKIGRAVRNHSR